VWLSFGFFNGYFRGFAWGFKGYFVRFCVVALVVLCFWWFVIGFVLGLGCI